jgi:hypothetical protein
MTLSTYWSYLMRPMPARPLGRRNGLRGTVSVPGFRGHRYRYRNPATGSRGSGAPRPSGGHVCPLDEVGAGCDTGCDQARQHQRCHAG